MKLVICGNGFDLHHGLKTGYSHYRTYLQDNVPDVLKKFESFPWLNPSCIGDLWSDVENSLRIDYDGMCAKLEEYVSDTKCGDEYAWAELRTDFEEWTRFIYRFTGEEFYKWIQKINTKILSEPEIVKILEDAVCVNFNYTDTLESGYGVPTTDILHIHGRRELVHDENCFGHDVIPSFSSIEEAELADGPIVSSDKWNSDIVRDEMQFGAPVIEEKDSRIECFVERCSDKKTVNALCEFYDKSSKKLFSNIGKLSAFLEAYHITEVHVMGLSLTGIDDFYFERVFSPKLSDCKWHFYFFGTSDDLAEADRRAKNDFAEKHGLYDKEFQRW